MPESEELRYEFATQEHAEQLVEFLVSYFMVEESITASINGQRPDVAPLFEDMVQDAVKSPVSVVVFNAKNELVGCRLSMLIDFEKKRKFGSSPPPESLLQKFTDKSKIIVDFLDRLEEGMMEMVPLNSCDLCLKFLIVSVRPDYYRKGIAGKSIRMSCAAARELGATHVTVTATAFKSQALFTKNLGFSTLKVVRHSDFLHPDGEQVFKCGDGTDCGMLMMKKLSEMP